MIQMKGQHWIYAVFIAAYLWWGIWLVQYPMQISSDDAFNFSRAVERFSVLEFRPHFPGYPAFVAMSWGVSLFGSGIAPNILVSFLSVLAIPPLLFALVFRLSQSGVAAVFAGFLVMTQPLMGALALSGLSDSMALAMLLLAFISALSKRYAQVGLWIGLMLAARPSYFPLAASFLLLPLIIVNRQERVSAYIKAASVILVIGVCCFIFVMAKDGTAYFGEGVRFTQGHFDIWGNTASSQDMGSTKFGVLNQWLVTLSEEYGTGLLVLILLSLIVGLFAYKPCAAAPSHLLWQRAISIVGVIYLLWIFLAQNPDNLRHWGPVFLLFSVVFPLQLSTYLPDTTHHRTLGAVTILSVFCFGFKGGQHLDLSQRNSPVQQVIQWLNNNKEIQHVGTNYQVNLIRDTFKDRAIYDMYYPSNEKRLLKSSHNAYRISGTELVQHKLIQTFPARFSGERKLFLYKLSQ
ncbi:hypothetical protein [Vibrio sp. HN007]|uniref:hypothetical protein n=1 Tax=Vibrio iocasae TaxID=3098914 RepID=UPI0035D428D2